MAVVCESVWMTYSKSYDTECRQATPGVGRSHYLHSLLIQGINTSPRGCTRLILSPGCSRPGVEVKFQLSIWQCGYVHLCVGTNCSNGFWCYLYVTIFDVWCGLGMSARGLVWLEMCVKCWVLDWASSSHAPWQSEWEREMNGTPCVVLDWVLSFLCARNTFK